MNTINVEKLPQGQRQTVSYEITEAFKSVVIQRRRPRQGEQDNLKRVCGQEIRTKAEIDQDSAEEELVKIKETPKEQIPIA